MKTKTLLCASLLFVNFSISAQTGNTNHGTGAGNSGNRNTSIGYNAGDVVTLNDNVFVGYYAGKINNSSNNAFVGSFAGQSSTGISNSFFGNGSGSSNTGSQNTFIGASAGWASSGCSRNTTVGANSGDSNIGSYNTYIGFATAANIVGGEYNTFLGYYSGYESLSGSNNVYLGSYSGRYSGGSNNVFVGYSAGANETGSNRLYIENSNSALPLIYGDFSTDKVGINSLPIATHTLTVGGTIHSTGLFVNGVPVSGDMSLWNRTGNNVFTISTTDNIGIGTTLANNPNNYKLGVNGKIGAKEVQIENTSSTWADYVFKPDYKLMTLTEVESFIKKNQHLPEIPSAKDIEEHGHKLGEMDVLLLKKVEELTLYVIQLKKEIEELKKGNE